MKFKIGDKVIVVRSYIIQEGEIVAVHVDNDPTAYAVTADTGWLAPHEPGDKGVVIWEHELVPADDFWREVYL